MLECELWELPSSSKNSLQFRRAGVPAVRLDMFTRLQGVSGEMVATRARNESWGLKPGNANLPIGDLQNAIQENGVPRLGGRIRERQPHLKQRVAGLRGDLNVAAMLFHNALHRVEAEAGPLAYTLGREEGLKDVRLHVG